MSETRSLHVLVAGEGLAGLATAQGALKAGHTVQVFERDVNDAALLTEQLDRYGRGEVDLLDAIGTYEEQMRETAYPILRMTVDHDKNFGGGALAEATKGSEPA